MMDYEMITVTLQALAVLGLPFAPFLNLATPAVAVGGGLGYLMF